MDTTDATNAAHALEPTEGPLLPEELQLAFRNRGMPLEALRHDVTPTGLHYLVVHWDIPAVDRARWRLRIGGCVRRPLELGLGEICDRPARTVRATLECAGNGRGWLSPRPVSLPWLGEAVGTAEWTGVPLRSVLEEAGVEQDVAEIVFRGSDRGLQGETEQEYARSLALSEALRPDVLLAYAMNGSPLEPQHGFPLRLLVPGWYGMASVKWLSSIEALPRRFDGFQQAVAYRYQRDRDDPGEPVTRMRVRSLMVPPGIPDFFSRQRYLERGPTTLRGRAWSGEAAVTRVEVCVDGRWSDASLGPDPGYGTWRSWSFSWDASPGVHELRSRAADAAGNIQPLEASWNYQGMGNNAVQPVVVTTR